MTTFFARRPLRWLLLGVFAALYTVRSSVGAGVALSDGDQVILFWRVVELVFFAWLAVISIRRTTVPAS